MKTLLRKIGLTFLYELAGSTGRKAADGGFGPKWQQFYLWTRGKKRWSGVACGLASVMLSAAGQDAWAAGISILASGLLAAGLVDDAWRTTIPTLLGDWRTYQWARAHGALITSLLLAASAAVASCAMDLSAALVQAHLTCSSAAMILAGLTAGAATLGITADAKLAEPPRMDNPVPPAKPKLAGMPPDPEGSK